MTIENETQFKDPIITIAAKVGYKTGNWEPLRRAIETTSVLVAMAIRKRIN